MAASSSAAPVVEAAVWYSVAGATVQIPPANSYVYYFPEGHLEQHHYPPAAETAGTAVENLNINVDRPIFPCRVLSSDLLYNPHSDQAYAKILLQPSYTTTGDHHPNKDKSVVSESDVVWHAKILTASDANNGGGFSVPRCCADSVFPRLDFAADPPLQTLRIRDGHGGAWEFRHIYRGTPRRHLLTTGWSKFVNAGAHRRGRPLVFMRKKSSNELFIGIRRANGKFGGI
ncbi:hypothetical protein DH2020_007054 [Rehmannia glutinosa]|uniref:TF-B3 domain-containing protein n=1 Tax=Rehmannia glutinosa TaxID=99300 RepID=A0ABR0TWT9_REHGL